MKTAIVVLADTETHEALGRAVNAMVTALDFKETGDDVQVIFDGGGTRWPPVLAAEDHQAHDLYARIEDTVRAPVPTAPTRSSPPTTSSSRASNCSTSTSAIPASAPSWPMGIRS